LQYFASLDGQDSEELSQRKLLLQNSNLQFLSWADFESISRDQLRNGYSSQSFGDFQFSHSPRVYTNLDQ